MDAWTKIKSHYKTQGRIAEVVGVRQPSVSQRLRSGGNVPAEWAMAIHRDSGIPLHEIRPDLWPA